MSLWDDNRWGSSRLHNFLRVERVCAAAVVENATVCRDFVVAMTDFPSVPMTSNDDRGGNRGDHSCGSGSCRGRDHDGREHGGGCGHNRGSSHYGSKNKGWMAATATATATASATATATATAAAATVAVAAENTAAAAAMGKCRGENGGSSGCDGRTSSHCENDGRG